ncbi:putative phage integrase/recombinase [Bradyrhizobium sp. ORS 375]|nr:putative phage integrase/recombinase [Bradyrhizobium sp. ORS 375]
MPRPRKPYLHKETNRHGRTVWYVRNKDIGGKRTRIRGEYGSIEFNRNYDIAVADMFNRPRLAVDPSEARAKVFDGSLKWLWEEYKAKAPDWREMKASTHKQRNSLMFHVLEANGNKRAAAIQKQHILDGLGRRAQNPSAARHFLTTMRRMFAWAVAQKILPVDPTEGIKTPKPAKTEGFVTWSDADVRRYYKRWPLGTRERVMIDVYLFTGFRRGDAASFGPADVTEQVQERIGPDGKLEQISVPIITKRLEKGSETIEVTFPMLDVLRRTLEAGPVGTETYIATRQGKPMTKESLGNLFKEKCVAAGLANRSAHGLRKAAATVAAENGATEAELDAIFGWTDRRMASHYTRNANRKKLAYGGVAKLERMIGSADHRANVYSLTDKLGAGNRTKSSMKTADVRKGGGHDRDRTCDPYHVKVVLSR